MKTKNTIELVEPPIIDSYEFHENNGIINPAFLEAHPGLEETYSSPLNTDYRQNSFKNGKTFVHYPSPLPVTTTQPNGTSIASSWVYEFNNGCSSNLSNPNMNGSSSSLTNMYRSAYGYNDQPIHLSYDMDLSRDHRKISKESRCCPKRFCPTIVRIFVWTIIVLSILGIAFSIAFIIYIENVAPDECCTNNTTNSYYQSTGEPKVTPNSGYNYTLSVNITTAQDMTTTISYSTNGTKPSITESTHNSSSDLLVTNSSLVINDQNPILKLNDSKTTENSKIIETTIPYISVTTPLKPDITPKMIFSNNGTTPFETTATTTTATTTKNTNTSTIPTTTTTTTITTTIPTTASTTDFISNKSSIRSIVSEKPLTQITKTVSTTSTTSTTNTPTITMLLTSWTSNQSEMTTHQTDLNSRQIPFKEQQNSSKMNSTESSVEITTEAMIGTDYDIVDSVIKSITSDEQNTTLSNN